MITTEFLLSIKDDKSILANFENEDLFELKEQLVGVRNLSKIVEDYIDRCLDRTIGQQLQSELESERRDDGSHTFNYDKAKVVASKPSRITWDADLLRNAYVNLSEKGIDKETLDNIFKFSVLSSKYNTASETIKTELQKCRTKTIGEDFKYKVTLKGEIL
mgnify:CR=1 FL=1|jgi:hypothetical protein|tara:strand:+ start:4882 stop:5364 length:483 start_codon:yes stop_codon:yes gene_type:complete